MRGGGARRAPGGHPCGLERGGRGGTTCESLVEPRLTSRLCSGVLGVVIMRGGCGSPSCSTGSLTGRLGAGAHCLSTMIGSHFNVGCSYLLGRCEMGSTLRLLASGHCTSGGIRRVDTVINFTGHRSFCTTFCGGVNRAPGNCHGERLRSGGWLHFPGLAGEGCL